MGSYTIAYTVRAPWTNTPSVTVKRSIEVSDVDECSLKPGSSKWDKVRRQGLALLNPRTAHNISLTNYQITIAHTTQTVAPHVPPVGGLRQHQRRLQVRM